MKEIKAALIRLVRVLIAQAVSWICLETAGINVPVINVSIGALINSIAKYLRDKYKWQWLPI